MTSNPRHRPTWTNWANTATATPVRVVHPANAAEVGEIVRRAAQDGLRVKAVGSGHSFTPVGVTDGVLLVMDRMNRVDGVDPERRQVTVGAGITLRALNPALLELGLALPNLGDVDPQTITGAISTGTHGTGDRLTGLADAVVGLDLVTGSGDLIHIDGSEPELFGAARVGLGALGIICSVTLQCVPAFLLHAHEAPMRLPQVFERLDALVAGNDHFELYWFPHTDRALTKANNRVEPTASRRPVGRVRHLVDDELLSNAAFELLNRVARRRRTWTPRLNQVSARVLSERSYVDDSYQVFISPRRVRFREMEYAVPRDVLVPCLTEIDRWLRMHDETVAFPVEVRFAALDDIWLSTGYGRANAYIAVHQYHRVDHRPYFEAVEQIVAAADGRPHWGKLHRLGASALRTRYPRFDDFGAVRDRLDPARTFSNAYLDRVLG